MIFFFSSGRRHTRFDCDWSSDVCSSDLEATELREAIAGHHNVKPEQVFVGNGSDEVLAHAFAALLKQPKPLLFPRSEERRVGKECSSRWEPSIEPRDRKRVVKVNNVVRE